MGLLIGLLLLAGPTLSGCLSPADGPPDAREAKNQPPGDNGSSANLSEPLPGPWDRGREYHYRGENGVWQNWTVLGVEEKHNYTTYKVHVTWSEPDNRGYGNYTVWIEVNSLGRVAEDQGASYGWFSTPWDQVLPLSNKSYLWSWYAQPQGFEGKGSTRVHLGVEDTISVPAGSLKSREVVYEVDEGARDRWVTWYAPQVAYYVSFVDRRGDFDWTRFNLTAWSP